MKDFNKVIENQVTSLVLTEGQSNELKIIDGNYMFTLLVVKIDSDYNYEEGSTDE